MKFSLATLTLAAFFVAKVSATGGPCGDTCRITTPPGGSPKAPCGHEPYGCGKAGFDVNTGETATHFYCQVGGEETGADGCLAFATPELADDNNWCLFSSPELTADMWQEEECPYIGPCGHTCRITTPPGGSPKDPCGHEPYGCGKAGFDVNTGETATHFYCQVGGEATGADGCLAFATPELAGDNNWCLFSSPGLTADDWQDEAYLSGDCPFF